MKALTEDQARVLYEYLKASNDPKDLVTQLLFETGARISEVLTLSPEGLDPETRTLRIRGLKGSNDRKIRLSEDLAAKVALCRPRKFGRLISESPKLPSQRRATQRHLERLGLELLGRKIHPHMLRHTAFTRLYVASKDLLGVKQWAGHKSINSTMVYMQADLMDEANDLMQNILGGSKVPG